jgi:Ca2+/Na+ antiporter
VSEPLYQFDFSEDNFKKKSLDVFLPVLIVCMFVFALFITGFKIKEALLCSCPVLLTAFIVWILEKPLIRRSLRKIKAFIHNDKIVKQCGKHENSIPWDNIARIKIRENRKGEIVHIQIRGKDKSILCLGGLNEMGKLAGLIRDRIPDNVLVNTKRNRFEPGIIVAITVVCVTIFMIIIASLGDKAMDVFASLFWLVASLFLLLYRPLSKSDTGLKWIEIVCSLLLMLLGIHGLIEFIVKMF